MKEYSEDIKTIENYMFSFFTSIDEYQKKVYESMLYSLSSGGKRLRPLLSILTYKAIAGEDFTEVVPFAAAIEFIHTYSLIHDDLPEMDDDDIRRGKPTNHKVFSEALAILAGDGLLNMAAEILSREIESMQDIEKIKKSLRAMKYMFTAAGVHGMIGGQVIDLGYADADSLEVCETMYRLKTAALIRAAVVSGAIIAGADSKEITNFEEFANNLGIAYQLKDDLLDADEDLEKENNTILKYLSKSELEVKITEYTQKALDILNSMKYDTTGLKELTAQLVGREF